MFRASLLFLTCFTIIGFSRGFDDFTTIPICENKSPNDVYLDLSKMEFRSIDRPFVSGDSVTCLNLAGNRVTRITKNAFDELPRLQYLNLAGNPLSMSDLSNVKLTKLKSLVLDELFSHESETHDLFWSDDFAGESRQNRIYDLPELEKLSISHWKTADDPLMWLDHFNAPNLRELYLIDSKITNLYLSTKIMGNLTHMYLDDNEVNSFMLGNNLPNLRHLSMNHNQLRMICGKDSSLSNNDHHMSPLGLHSLENLSLASNGIKIIDSDAFEDLQNLRSLNLAENLIEEFPKHTFDNMTNLKNLTLDGNQLTSVPDICALKNLEILSLNGNSIKTIDKTSFCSLPNLKVVRLSSNGLINVVDHPFENLPKFSTLDLSWNNLASLPKNWMAPHQYLDELRLDGNTFKDIESMSLEDFVLGLGSLSIGHNSNMKKMLISSLTALPKLTMIDVSRDCLISDHREFPID